jgi:hypothetical protein
VTVVAQEVGQVGPDLGFFAIGERHVENVVVGGVGRPPRDSR